MGVGSRWRALTIEQRRAELGEEEWARRTSPMTHDQVVEMIRSARNTPEAIATWHQYVEDNFRSERTAALMLHWMDLDADARAEVCDRSHGDGFKKCAEAHEAAAGKAGYTWTPDPDGRPEPPLTLDLVIDNDEAYSASGHYVTFADAVSVRCICGWSRSGSLEWLSQEFKQHVRPYRLAAATPLDGVDVSDGSPRARQERQGPCLACGVYSDHLTPRVAGMAAVFCEACRE